jgi:hypothetical protein
MKKPQFLSPMKHLFWLFASTRNLIFLFVCLIALATSGCLSTKSYLDPQFRRATLVDVKPSDNPVSVLVEASFQVNGENEPAVDKLVLNAVIKVMRATKVFSSIALNKQPNTPNLKIVVNDIGDMGAAGAKGFGTRLTYGLVGSEVVDNYEMTATYTPAGGSPITKIYKHALHSTFGVHTAPPGMEQVPRELAFDQIMEDMLLNLFCDLQKEGALK